MLDVLAINLGGTSVKWGTPNRHQPLAIQSRPAPSQLSDFPLMLEHIRTSLKRYPQAVAIGFPGPVGTNGTLSKAPTLWPTEDLSKIDLPFEIKTVFSNTEVFIINDVSAYGSYLLMQGYQDFCVLNIGSGIGSKVYANGQELNGPNARGGEIGHWRDPDVPAPLRCDCGEVGHVAAISSGRGLRRFAIWKARKSPDKLAASILDGTDIQNITTEVIAAAVRAGDAFATQVLTEAMQPLARAASLLHVAIGCEKFFLVGGVAEALKDYIPFILQASAKGHCWDTGLQWDGAFEVIEDEVKTSLIGLQRHAERSLAEAL